METQPRTEGTAKSTDQTIEDVLQSLVPRPSPLQAVRYAIRQREAQDLNACHARALASVASKLNYASAPYFLTFAGGLVIDAVFTLWDPIERALRSPLIAEFIEEEVGSGKSVVDALRYLHVTKAPVGETRKRQEELNNMVENIQRQQRYVEAVVAQCESTGKAPHAVLRSSREMVPVIKHAYGSIDEYATKQKVAVKKLHEDAFRRLETFRAAPAKAIATLLASKGVEATDVSEACTQLRLEPGELIAIARDYVGDVILFGDAFFKACNQLTEGRIKRYRAIESGKRYNR